MAAKWEHENLPKGVPKSIVAPGGYFSQNLKKEEIAIQ